MTESIWQAKAKKVCLIVASWFLLCNLTHVLQSHWLSYQRVWLSNLRRCVLETDELYGVPPSFAAPDEPDLLSACLSSVAKCALVVDLDETLVHAKFHQHSGWMIHQRAGAQKFLVEMAKMFEIIIFTSGIETYASPIIDRLDPQRLISHRLYRPATSIIKGLHVKNLARLARPLNRVIILDNSPESYILQPENAIPMKPYFGDESDAFLLNLIPVLESLHGLSDVRPSVMRIQKRGFPSMTLSMSAGADDQELLFPAPNPDALWQGESSSVSPAAPPPAPRIGSFKTPSYFPATDALPDISLGKASLPKQGISGFSIPGNSPPARQRSMSIFSSLQVRLFLLCPS
jgi:Dullard-like phosphatase family protein